MSDLSPTPRAAWQGDFPRRRLPQLLLSLALCHAATSAFGAQAAPLIAPNPEQQGIPSLRPGTGLAPVAPQPPAEPTNADTPDQVLPSAITRIDLQTPLLAAEIEALLRPFIGKSRLSAQALAQVQGQIWDLCRQHGHMTRVDMAAAPGANADGGSVLRVTVHDIRVRAVRVEQEGEGVLDPSLLDGILASTRALVVEGGALDLDQLDSRIKRRLFLGDVGLRAALVPVGPDEVDVKVVVRARPVAPIGFLLQADNYGMASYGRSRLTAGVSIPGRILAGDQLDLIAIHSDGMDFRRVSYELPLVPLGARLSMWGAQVDYAVPSTATGDSTRWGAGLAFPLRVDPSAVWTGHLNLARLHQVDRLSTRALTGDKRVDSLQARLDASYFLSAVQALRLQASWTHGQVDLSGLPAALAQDRASARTQGSFDKLEWDGSWSTLLGSGGAWDARIGAKGQFASRNLDQSEKLALGGTNGVRAYGPSEALGDAGHIVSAELGYRPLPWLRSFVFYDQGRIQRHRQPWVVDAAPPSYSLRGGGVGMAFSFKSLVGSLTYARQLGSNPGRTANGLDSDGSGDRHRVWLSFTLWL